MPLDLLRSVQRRACRRRVDAGQPALHARERCLCSRYDPRAQVPSKSRWHVTDSRRCPSVMEMTAPAATLNNCVRSAPHACAREPACSNHAGSSAFAGQWHGEGGELSNAEIAEIHRCYFDRLLRRGRAILRDRAAAEDAVQDLFIKLICHGRAYRVAENKLSWLYRSLTNCCFEIQRRGARYCPSPIELRDGGFDPQAAFLSTIAISRALGRLPAAQRRLAVRVLVEGASQEEIAQEVGWSRQTVNMKVQAVRLRLAKLLTCDRPSPALDDRPRRRRQPPASGATCASIEAGPADGRTRTDLQNTRHFPLRIRSERVEVTE